MPWLSLHSVYFMERLQGYVHQRWGMKGTGWVRVGPGSRGLQPNYIHFSLATVTPAPAVRQPSAR